MFLCACAFACVYANKAAQFSFTTTCAQIQTVNYHYYTCLASLMQHAHSAISRVCARRPWMQIKLLQVLALLGQHEAATSVLIHHAVCECIQRADILVGMGAAVRRYSIFMLTRKHDKTRTWTRTNRLRRRGIRLKKSPFNTPACFSLADALPHTVRAFSL